MPAPANSRVESLIPRPTAFKPGVSGNPRGRLPGTRNKATVEVREIATRLIDDPAYLQCLRERLLAGSAGPIEIVLWYYAFGKPPDRVETGEPDAFTALTDAELIERLRRALTALQA